MTTEQMTRRAVPATITGTAAIDSAGGSMRIVLATMPWHLLETPCLPIGLLRARIFESSGGRDTVHDYYGNLRWAEYLASASGGALGPADYAYVADDGIWQGVGDWIFVPAVRDQVSGQSSAYLAHLRRAGVSPGEAVAMREHAVAFAEAAAADILAFGPDLVGFTTTFQQNMASLAVARRLKRERPDLPVVFGGGNCELPMGPALHRNFGWIDYVLCGEAEETFPQLIEALALGQPLADIPGLCWRKPGGGCVVNRPAGTVPVDLIPAPDYAGWQAALDSSPLRGRLRPMLVYEAARGCWWGEKHHCTFCGLNGTAMAFRSKPAARAWSELSGLIRRHRILDVVTVDNILDPGYLGELLPLICESGWDLRIRYEVKANLRLGQLAALRAAGICHIQPGIESLSARVLGLMRKGVHSAQNVATLRDAQDCDMTVDWNWLYGFPGETAADYQPVIGQLPGLVHLQPPHGVTRILLERFSPYFERPELGFRFRRPAAMYQFLYDLPAEELSQLAYQFESSDAGITGETEASLQRAVEHWKKVHAESLLVRISTGDGLVICDTRGGLPRQEHLLADPGQAAAYELLAAQPRTPDGLARQLAERGLPMGTGAVRRWLDRMKELRLVFEDGGRAVALAGTRQPLRVPEPAP
jgi:ribosomal peptide maturation radical SAM protein 1